MRSLVLKAVVFHIPVTFTFTYPLQLLRSNYKSSFTFRQERFHSIIGCSNQNDIMSSLNEEKDDLNNNKVACVPCASLDKSHILSLDEIKSRLENDFKLWQLVQKSKDNSNSIEPYYLISRSFTTKNFQCALDCINLMGAIAEQEQHHPNFHLTNYRDVEIELYTHKLGGVTDNDFLLAKLLDSKVKVEYSPKWLKEHPKAELTVKK